MATKKRKIQTKTKPSFARRFAQKYLLSSQALPFVITFTCLGLFFVLIRMKGIEQDYQYHEVSKAINQSKTENKELKAEKARMLSVKNLRTFAKKFNLKEPDEKQIVIIP